MIVDLKRRVFPFDVVVPSDPVQDRVGAVMRVSVQQKCRRVLPKQMKNVGVCDVVIVESLLNGIVARPVDFVP